MPLDRSVLTFEQAEGLEPLPSQLALKQLSDELRAHLWQFIWNGLERDRHNSDYGSDTIEGIWRRILEHMHVFKFHRMIDEFDPHYDKRISEIKSIIQYGTYSDVFGWLQAVMRIHPQSAQFGRVVDSILTNCRSAYRVVDGRTIVPLATAEEREAVEKALQALRPSNLQGAFSHLRTAAIELSEGFYADSVRNSIHTVEAVARVITRKDKLSDALAELEKHAEMHQAMKRGFTALYGWTSDEAGIRHPLLEEGDAKVTEADAVFMLGACASFATLLVAKGRAAGMLA